MAILAVMAVHIAVPFAELGMLGVELFFVLSGFLITTLLMGEHSKTGSISLVRFWLRRSLRLMPAYWVYAGGLTIAIGMGLGELTVHQGWTPGALIRSIWLYYANYAPAGGIWSHQLVMVHLWSLAIEEQFYLIWPLILLLSIRLRIAEPLAWGLALTILIRNLLAPTFDTHLIQSRGFAIVLGCAVALRLWHSRSLRERVRVPAVGAYATLASLALIAFGTAGLHRGWFGEEDLFRRLVPALCVGFAAIIANLWYGTGGPLVAALSKGPLVLIGKLSYGMYLYHMLVRELTWEVFLAGIESWNRWLKFGIRAAVYLLLTFLLALASYHFLEKPFLALKSRFRGDAVRRRQSPASQGSNGPADGPADGSAAAKGGAARLAQSMPNPSQGTALI